MATLLLTPGNDLPRVGPEMLAVVPQMFLTAKSYRRLPSFEWPFHRHAAADLQVEADLAASFKEELAQANLQRQTMQDSLKASKAAAAAGEERVAQLEAHEAEAVQRGAHLREKACSPG